MTRALSCRVRSLSIRTALVVSLLCGCEQNNSGAVYDTKSNPKGFPQAACELIEGIESRRLDDFDAITGAFAALYIDDPELLGDDDWHTIVTRLGRLFFTRGDEEAGIGLRNFTRAAGFYDLAAFSRPYDTLSAQRSALFDAWRQAIMDSLIDTTEMFSRLTGPWPAVDKIEAVKSMYFGDSLQRVFAEKYLAPQLLSEPSSKTPSNDDSFDSLAAPDRAFLGALGLVSGFTWEPAACFADTAIDLVAHRIRQLKDNFYRAELYFVRRKEVRFNCTIALWIEIPDPDRPSTVMGSGYFSADITPAIPTSRWPVGQVMAVGRMFSYTGPVAEVLVGLYSDSGPLTGFAPIAASADSLLRLTGVIRR